MSSALATRIAADHAAAAASLPAGVVSLEQRRSAIEILGAEGLPTSRDENWKYANLRPLEKVRFVPPASAPPVNPADLPSPIEGYARYTFVDGLFSPALSSPVSRPGITVASSVAVGSLPKSKDARFALLNDAFATDGVSIRVAAGTECATCIELVFVASTDLQAGSSYPRAELLVEAGARVGLIERHVSVGAGASFVSASVKVDVARDASVTHYRVQQSGAKTLLFDTLSATLAQNATYRLHGVNVGGLSARSTVNVQLAGEHAEASIAVASLGDRQQIQDAFVQVEHAAPRARSEQTFRGISSGRARVAFNGMVVVRKNATGTDSQQSLRGLLAGPEAEIDVRPQLEIYTDDVRCSHGATAGKLDDDMLFYLLSRGIDAATAQRLLKWAFLEDVVAKIEVPELRRQIERSLAGQMQEAWLTGLPGAGL
ncbi:MAG TPA: Fe-S cluster assembly protein SufD [Steroidobacteraceae bacterium]|nr:Fe-S cluster assembly protein SufD [Steroidobacteraceae bacterium]